jgi:asparagine synthase (glutamine-hydrolysing)
MLEEISSDTVPVLLQETDLVSMAYSVEARAPYLDRSLAEFLYTVPTRHLIDGGYSKSLLREAADGYLVDSVRLDREKRGFNAPISSLLDTHDPMVRDYLLDDGPIFDLVRRDAVESLIDRDTLTNSYSKFLFNFVSAKLFLENEPASPK